MKYAVEAAMLFSDRAARDKVASDAVAIWLESAHEVGDSFYLGDLESVEGATDYQFEVRARTTKAKRDKLHAALVAAKDKAKNYRLGKHTCKHDTLEPCADFEVEESRDADN